MRKRAIFCNLKGRLQVREPLACHTTFRIGGPAQYLLHPRDTADLQEVLREIRRCRLPVRVIGAGSNILVADRGVRAAVIKLDMPFFRALDGHGRRITCAAGVGVGALVSAALGRGLGGLEFLYGIPGTVGGALVMNAGAWGSIISERVEKITVMDYNGTVREIDAREAGFGYRESALGGSIVLSAVLRLLRRDRARIRHLMQEYRRRRSVSQESGRCNAGCVFKNPPQYSAGYLIEACGLKGRRQADARVSSLHANFIINTGNATARDVRGLMRLMRARVKSRFGILLTPEIKMWR